MSRIQYKTGPRAGQQLGQQLADLVDVERQYEVLSQGTERTRRSVQRVMMVRCPFCEAQVKVYVWSLCGGGKLCACGAKFQSGGRANKVVEVAPQTVDVEVVATGTNAVHGFELISIRLTRGVCSSLACSEEGRHEDYKRALAEYEAEPEPKGDKPEPCLAFVVASLALESRSSRYVTVRVTAPDEAADLYYAVCSGTFQIDHPTAANRIADILRERVRLTDPDVVRRWPAPSGR